MTLPCPLTNANPSLTALKEGLFLSLSPRHSGRHGGRAASRRPRCLVCWPLTIFIWRHLKVGGRPQLTAAPPHPHYSGPSSPLWSRRRAVFRHLLGGGSAAVELAPVPPHRGLWHFAGRPATSSSCLGRLAVELRVVNWARPRSGALPGRAVWFTMPLIRPRPPHANVFPFSKARR